MSKELSIKNKKLNNSKSNTSTHLPIYPSTDIAIKVEGVSKKYCKSLKRSMLYGIKDIARNTLGLSSHSDKLRKNEFWALDDVSFEVKKGETLGIIGPNGSGKTTLLKLLNGIFWPDKGKISIEGNVGALIEVGAGFHPLLTGSENIYINAAILGMTKKEVDEKFDDIVEFADIGDFLDVPVKHYSSGMFVRLGFAVAVHCDPDILLVDEVLAVGDSSFRKKSSERMKYFIKNGNKSIVIVTHNMQTVEALADKVILLNHGKKIISGKANDVIAQYELLMRSPERKDTKSIIVPRAISDNKKEELLLVQTYNDFDGNEVEIKKVWLESSNGKRSTQFYGNDDVAVCISYNNNAGTKIQNGFIWISFINEYDINCMGARLCLGDDGTPETLPESGIVRIWFRPLQLTTSSYKISVAFFDHTYTVAYAQGHYGYIKVINDIPTLTPGISTPVCWPKCKWEINFDK